MTLVQTSTIFGRIVSGADVETWSLSLCRKWASTYLAEVERQHALDAGFYQRPRAYIRTISFDKMPEDQLPAVMVVSTGIATPPVRFGDGTFTARWLMGLAVLCSAATQEQSHDMARHYVAAMRELFNEQPDLGGHANGTDWLDERYDDLAYDDLRSLSSGQAHFAVEVMNVGSFAKGPVSPDPLPVETDPWPLWPIAETVEVVVEQET